MSPQTIFRPMRRVTLKRGAITLGAFAAGSLLFGATAVQGEGGGGASQARHIETHATYQFTTDTEVSASTDILPGDCGCITRDDAMIDGAIAGDVTVAVDGGTAGADLHGEVAADATIADSSIEGGDTSAHGDMDATVTVTIDDGDHGEDADGSATLDVDGSLEGALDLDGSVDDALVIDGSGDISAMLAVSLTD